MTGWELRRCILFEEFWGEFRFLHWHVSVSEFIEQRAMRMRMRGHQKREHYPEMEMGCVFSAPGICVDEYGRYLEDADDIYCIYRERGMR